MLLAEFFRATDVQSGQTSFPFWIYDFGVIPIQTISAIYERFLKRGDKRKEKPNNPDEDVSKREGVFYTPRFLAELSTWDPLQVDVVKKRSWRPSTTDRASQLVD